MERRSSTSTANRALSALLLVVAGLAFAVACTKPHAEPEPVKADYAPNLAGDVTGPAAFNVVSKLAGVALPTPPGSGTTALVDTTGVLSWGSAPAVISPGTSGQIYQSNAVPAAVWVTETGDCTLSATGVQTCTQLQGGEITAGASTGTLTCNGGATACGLTQNSQSGVIPNVMDIIPQASTNANGNGGDLLIKLPALSGSGTAGYLGLDLAGTGVIASSGTIRSNSALQWSYRNAGNTADASLLTLTGGASLTIGNVGTINTTAILGFGPVYMEDGSNDYYQLQGGVISEAISNTVVRYVSSAGQQFFHAAPDFGSGVGVVGLGVATTAPAAAPTTAGDVIVWSDTTGTHFWDHAAGTTGGYSGIGWDSTAGGDGLWLSAGTTPTNANEALNFSNASENGQVILNAPAAGQGFLSIGGAQVSDSVVSWQATGLTISGQSGSPANELVIANSAAIPTNTGVYANVTTATAGTANTMATGLVYSGGSATPVRTSIAPYTVGTHHSQASVLGQQMTYAQTIAAAKDVDIIVQTMTTTTCEIQVHCVGRLTSTGSIGGTIGDAADVTFSALVKNIAGTATLVGTNSYSVGSSTTARGDTSQVGDTCVGTTSGSTFHATVAGLSTQGTVDWTLYATTVCD